MGKKNKDEAKEKDVEVNVFVGGDKPSEEEPKQTSSTDEKANADTKDEPKEKSAEDKLKEDYDSLNSKLQRLQADFYNYKQRTEREKTATYGNAVADVLTDLLSVIDNFERALATEDSKNEEVISFKSGMNMIYGQLMNVLQKKGLKEIEALDAKFDPNKHSGIGFEPSEEKEEDTIIEVFQKGYTINDKVIRPSMVKIVKNN